MIKNTIYQSDIEKIAKLDLQWDKLSNSTVFITGASGLINSSLIDILMYRNLYFSANIHIIGVGRNEEKFWKRFSAYKDSENLEFFKADINNPFDYDGEITYIINGASNTHPVAYAKQPIETIMTNITGTNNLLDFALKHNTKRVVQMSSVEVFGENRGDVDKFEENYCGYINCNLLRAGYPESKRTSEALCQAYIAAHDLDIVIARPCRIYGPTMGMDDSKASAQFIKNVLAGEDIVLKSKGTQQFSYCYMSDVASALIYILLYGEKGQAYNIADKNSDTTLKELAEMIAKANNKKVIFDLPSDVEKAGSSTVYKSLMDATKLEALGWKAFTDLAEGTQKTIKILSEANA